MDNADVVVILVHIQSVKSSQLSNYALISQNKGYEQCKTFSEITNDFLGMKYKQLFENGQH